MEYLKSVNFKCNTEMNCSEQDEVFSFAKWTIIVIILECNIPYNLKINMLLMFN